MSLDPTSWTKAEHKAFELLCNASSLVEGKTAFIGKIPKVFDFFALLTAELSDPQTLWETGEVPSTVRMDYRIVAKFRERSKAQEFFMRIISVMPIECAGDGLQLFRVSGNPNLVLEQRQEEIANMKDTQPLFVLELGCELIFTTGEAQ